MKMAFFIAKQLLLLLSYAMRAPLANALGGFQIPASAALHTKPRPPVFPESYSVKYIFSMPYTAQVQPNMIKYEVTLHRDASRSGAKRVRMETLNGTNIMIAIAGDAEYQIGPQIDEQKCKVFPGGYAAASANALPDISTWVFSGEDAHFEDALGTARVARLWTYVKKQQGKTTSYTFYVSADDDRPLRLHMIGKELTEGSHFGEYVVDFLQLAAGVPKNSLFEPPSLCKTDEGILIPGDGHGDGKHIRISRFSHRQKSFRFSFPTTAFSAGGGISDASPTALRMLVTLRALGAVLLPIADCDETFN